MDILEKIDDYLTESDKDTFGEKFNKMFWWDKSITDPKKVQKHVRDMSDKDLLSLQGGPDDKAGSKTPRELQIKIIKQEIKRRGL